MFLAYVCFNLFYLLYKWLIFISNKFMSLININISVKFQYRFFRFRIEAFWIFEREWLHYRFFFLVLLQISELKKKLGSQSQFSTHRKNADESTKQLQYEIQSLKAQKVKLLAWMYFFVCISTTLFLANSSLVFFINLCLRIGSTAM